MAAIEIVMSEIDIFVPSTGNSNFFTLEQMKKLDNNAVVGKSVNLQRDRFGWPRGLGNQSRQHQASKDRSVLLVGHDVIVLVPGPQKGLPLAKELVTKVVSHFSTALPLLGCEFHSMVLSLAVVAVMC